jgi:hypothetical protein
MFCTECGLRFDPANDSQVACPCCGTDPTDPLRPEDDSDLAAAFEDGEAFAEALVAPSEMLGGDAPVEQEIDYVPDPELDLVIADGEALMHALTDGPILVAGNMLVN